MARTDSLLIIRTSDGAIVNRVSWDGHSVYTMDADHHTAPDNGEALYSPPAPPPTTIAPLDLMARMTQAEQMAVMTAAQTKPIVALFIAKLTGALSVDVTDPIAIAGFALIVADGEITQARAAQILDLSKPSP